nr:MAG TPA: hypothetical protein [Caudoviricetes sp.]
MKRDNISRSSKRGSIPEMDGLVRFQRQSFTCQRLDLRH